MVARLVGILVGVVLAVCIGSVGLIGSTTETQAATTDAGYRDFSFGTSTSSPTGNKAQSKLWYTNDGIWWGSLFDTSTNDYYIHRLDQTNQSWSNTGTLIDKRNNSKADTLWDGTHLYVATAVVSTTGTDQAAKLLRYSYNATTKSYTLDAGFPVTVGSGPMEALSLEKDSTGKLWVTFTQADATGAMKVWVNHSLGADSSWDQPMVVPVPGTTIKADDISAIVSFDLRTQAPKIGVMWSNQLDDKVYFAAHTDGAPDSQWQSFPAALQGPKSADDHINIKSLQTDPSGRVFAVLKTSFGDVSTVDPNTPQIYMVVLGQDGSFSKYVFGRVVDDHTRPILMIDETNRYVYVFATAPVSPGGTIYYKKAPLDNISFPVGLGTPFIKSSTDTTINNATSTKQNATAGSGIVVLAADDNSNFYLHNTIDLSGTTPPPPSDTTAPATPTGFTATASSGGIALDWSDNTEPDLAGYNIYRSDTAGGTFTKLNTTPLAGSQYNDTQAPEGQYSYYRLTAIDTSGNESAPATDSAFRPAASSTPSCTITGTSGNDTLTGTSGKDVICGLGGNDTIKGAGGDDTLIGGEGNDTLIGGGGSDALDGGSGTDTADFAGSRAIQASLSSNTATGLGSDTMSGIENLSGSSGNDDLTGSDGPNTLLGRAGADTLQGGAGDDTINSKDKVNGNDSLDGGAGTDTKITDATEKSIVGFP